MELKKLNLIVAAALNRGIGFQGSIPWRLKKDLALFAKLTKSTSDPAKRNAVIMGRKTWESIPEKNRPLPSRLNVILSRACKEAPTAGENILMCQSLEEALNALQSPPISNTVENIWIIGGASVYQEALNHPQCQRIYVTQVRKEFECDVFMPVVDTNRFSLTNDSVLPVGIQEENGIEFQVQVYEKIDKSMQEV